MVRRSLLALAFLLTTFFLGLLITGGFVTTVAGVRVSARSPLPAVAVAALALVIWAILARRAGATSSDLIEVEQWVERRSVALIATIAGISCAVAVLFNSFSAGGSDASGYLSNAAMLQRGELTRDEPLIAIADWPAAATTLAPLGWQARLEGGRQVPTYAIGLPLLIALPHAIGGTLAASLIVPLTFFGAVAVTGLLARRFAGGAAGVIAAMWLATSPVAMIESMQMMSDVPVTAAWLGCWALLTGGQAPLERWRSTVAGTLGALAVLIRPNLAPLAIVPALWIVSRGRRGFSRAVWYSAPVALAGLVVGYLQWRYFGSPLRSGYGTADEIYALANVMPNVRLYGAWLLDAHGPWLLAAPLALVWPSASRRRMRWLLAFGALVIAGYLLYAVFETWTYLRFLLPALAIAMIAVATIIAAALAKLPVTARVPLLAVLVLALAATNLAAAVRLGVFRFAAQQSRALLAGRYLESALPLNAVVISGEQSGAVRYYTDRPIVRWDFLDPATLDRAVARLASSGREVWIALDVWEEEPFRAKFRGSTPAALDWPPIAEAGTELRTRVWRLEDRDPFLRDGRSVMDRLR